MGEALTSLTQHGLLHEERHFLLKPNGELRVACKDAHQEKEYCISLLALADSARRRLNFSRRLLLIAVTAMLTMLVLTREQVLPLLGLANYALPVVLVFSLLALVCLLLCVRSFSYDYVFYSMHADVPLVSLMVTRPSLATSRRFVRELEARIGAVQAEAALSLEKQLAGELRTIRRLTEEGVLDACYYPAAKEHLLRLNDPAYRTSQTAGLN
ncbi:MAG: hypothetical protein OEZ39_08730 [Gammaproteobacteria bacterium]|nr:hypothetical protein [Gammaproteobacteria bacterium]MDH5651948.1 hypothetical protein [Gammaproteobacteria bacterium]